MRFVVFQDIIQKNIAKEHYDRINFTLPIGKKERIRHAASGLGMSVNEYLYALACDDLASGESKFGKKRYFIYLKEGFINDVTGSRSIHCEKTSEVRRIIGKTHKK